MQIQFQLGSYIHACTNKTHFLVNLKDLFPTLAVINVQKAAKVGNKSCRFASVCFICAFMDVPTQLELCLQEQT